MHLRNFSIRNLSVSQLSKESRLFPYTDEFIDGPLKPRGDLAKMNDEHIPENLEQKYVPINKDQKVKLKSQQYRSGDHPKLDCKNCSLMPNGSWAHIPRSWLNLISTILDIVNEAILDNDITALYQLRESYQGFFSHLVTHVPLHKSIRRSLIIKTSSSGSDVSDSEFMIDEKRSSKMSMRKSRASFLINEFTSEDINKYTHNVSYLASQNSVLGPELLECLRNVQTSTRRHIRSLRISNTSKDTATTAIGEDSSDSFSLKALFKYENPFTKEREFNELMQTQFEYDVPLIKEESKKSDSDDSNFVEFNKKYDESDKVKTETEMDLDDETESLVNEEIMIKEDEKPPEIASGPNTKKQRKYNELTNITVPVTDKEDIEIKRKKKKKKRVPIIENEISQVEPKKTNKKKVNLGIDDYDDERPISGLIEHVVQKQYTSQSESSTRSSSTSTSDISDTLSNDNDDIVKEPSMLHQIKNDNDRPVKKPSMLHQIKKDNDHLVNEPSIIRHIKNDNDDLVKKPSMIRHIKNDNDDLVKKPSMLRQIKNDNEPLVKESSMLRQIKNTIVTKTIKVLSQQNIQRKKSRPIVKEKSKLIKNVKYVSKVVTKCEHNKRNQQQEVTYTRTGYSKTGERLPFSCFRQCCEPKYPYVFGVSDKNRVHNSINILAQKSAFMVKTRYRIKPKEYDVKLEKTDLFQHYLKIKPESNKRRKKYLHLLHPKLIKSTYRIDPEKKLSKEVKIPDFSMKRIHFIGNIEALKE